MPRQSSKTLHLTGLQLAVLMRVWDDPGIHATWVAARLPPDHSHHAGLVVSMMTKRGLLRRGEPYRANKGHYHRTPLYVSHKGEHVLRAHLKAIAGIEL